MPQSHEMRILLADNQAGTTNAISLAARNCDLIGDQTFGSDPGKRGTRQMYACGDRILREEVSGGFDIYPTAAEMDWFIERMFGDNISTYPAAAASPGETIPAIYAYVDKGDENFRYDELRMAEIIISLRPSDYINWRINFIGKDETSGVSWPASPPALSCASEFITPDAALNVASTAYPFKSMDISINNGFVDQFENAVKRSIFEPGTLSIGMQGLFGYRTATKALYRRGIAGDNGATIVLDDGNDTYTFTFGNIKIPGRGPTVPDDGEIPMNLNFMVKRTAAAPMLSIAKS